MRHHSWELTFLILADLMLYNNNCYDNFLSLTQQVVCKGCQEKLFNKIQTIFYRTVATSNLSNRMMVNVQVFEGQQPIETLMPTIIIKAYSYSPDWTKMIPNRMMRIFISARITANR